MAVRSNIQGTATCLPLEELLLLWSELLEELEPLEASPELLPDELEPGLELAPEELPELLKERMAKSTRPEWGLIMTSLMVASDSPELPLTSAPVSWVARTSWCPIRPVGLYWLLLELPDGSVVPLEEPGDPADPEDPPDEVCACATPTRHVTTRAMMRSSCFLIPAFFFCCFVEFTSLYRPVSNTTKT